MELENYIQTYFTATREELELLKSRFKSEFLEKGQYYLRQGRMTDKLSFIHTGLIRIFANADEKVVTQWISTSGYFITDLRSLLFQSPARWNMQALTDCSLYTISSADYYALGKDLPRWHQLEKLFIAKCFAILEDRVFSLLSLTAEERYQQLMTIQPELFNQVPLQYLASMMSMTPETLSRLRKKSSS